MNIVKSLRHLLHSGSGLNSITDNPYKVIFHIVLNPSVMERFKEKVLEMSFRYLDVATPFQYTTNQDNNGKVSYGITFPTYVMDRYCYFFPPFDFKYYAPKNYVTPVEFDFDEKRQITSQKLLEFIAIVENDIKSKLNPDKVRYRFADRREEKFEAMGWNKEWSAACSIYSEQEDLVGRVHSFCGNLTFTGHEEYNKADWARVTLYQQPEDEVYFVDMRPWKSDTFISFKKGGAFFRKEPIDYMRLEYCELVRFMALFCEQENGTLLASLGC